MRCGLSLRLAEQSSISARASFWRAIVATYMEYGKGRRHDAGLGWEMRADPTELERLVMGNSAEMILDSHEVVCAALAARRDVLINKTGSTNGFVAYAAFVPEKRVGIVIPANRNLPIGDRVTSICNGLYVLEILALEGGNTLNPFIQPDDDGWPFSDI